MTSVVITRPRHPLEGRSLRVLGRMRRHGRLELLVVLPDGSKRLIPQAWTDAGEDAAGDVVATLGSLTELLVACALVEELAGRVLTGQGQAARSHRPRRTPMQPVQLSLIPEPSPRPPATLVEQLPADAVATAVTLLARVIAKASVPAGIGWPLMTERKITISHLRRAAVIYVRQSTLAQVKHNIESTVRQYDLVSRAVELGWPRSAVRVIDDDLGVSGASTTGRSGFAELAAQVGLGQVGIVLSLEVSRLARNNTDWYRLLDLAGMADTLIADADGVYHPALFNDRLVRHEARCDRVEVKDHHRRVVAATR